MGALSPTHWLIIVGVLVVLFGAKRLPDAARSLGRSARILKSEVKDMQADPSSSESAEEAPRPAASPVAALAPVPPITDHLAPTAPASGAAHVDGLQKRDV